MGDLIKEYDKITKQLAKLAIRKEELTAAIISELSHDHEGQITYDWGIYKVECKTPMIYSLDKKAYESGAVHLDPIFDPVKKSISYTIDKKKLTTAMESAPYEARCALERLIEKKPGKSSVTVRLKS